MLPLAPTLTITPTLSLLFFLQVFGDGFSDKESPRKQVFYSMQLTFTATRVLYSVVKSKNTHFLLKKTFIVVCWTVWWADRFLIWWTTLHRDASGIMRIESFAQTVIMANDVNTRVQVCGKKKKTWKDVRRVNDRTVIENLFATPTSLFSIAKRE